MAIVDELPDLTGGGRVVDELPDLAPRQTSRVVDELPLIQASPPRPNYGEKIAQQRAQQEQRIQQGLEAQRTISRVTPLIPLLGPALTWASNP